MLERFTERARRLMAVANKEAIELDHNYLGTEHMLLGLLETMVATGVAGQVLTKLGVDIHKLREEAERQIGTCDRVETGTEAKLTKTDRAKNTLHRAAEEADGLNHKFIGTEHILLGLLHDPDGITPKLLNPLGVDAKAVRREIIAILGDVRNTDGAQEG